ncbi:Uma2 family endonuclease [Actinophytocola sp. NPDC049390]|uniref:Uma2 family endonuclease n=1 Tax=Actinophytocola sp. NPDC049390 TaxID=3363894 RepID=UPI0037ADC702
MIAPPDHLLTLDEWVALPEDNSRNYELQEGVVVANPKSHMPHQSVVVRFAVDVAPQLPPEWDLVGSVEVVTEPGFPASVRVPDLVIFNRALIGADAPHFTPEQVLVAVEVVAPGTRMVDTVVKPVEYAAAGIPFYWVIDLADPLSLVAHRLGDDGRYRETSATTGMFETNEPFQVRIDLAELPA